jgi:hypothetical protein
MVMRERWEEVIPERANDEVVVFEEFFVSGLRMPPRPTLTERSDQVLGIAPPVNS